MVRGLIPSGQAGIHLPQSSHCCAHSAAVPSSGAPLFNVERKPSRTFGASATERLACGITGQISTQAPQNVHASAIAADFRCVKSFNGWSRGNGRSYPVRHKSSRATVTDSNKFPNNFLRPTASDSKPRRLTTIHSLNHRTSNTMGG